MSRIVGIVICSILIAVLVIGYILYYLHSLKKRGINYFYKSKKKPERVFYSSYTVSITDFFFSLIGYSWPTRWHIRYINDDKNIKINTPMIMDHAFKVHLLVTKYFEDIVKKNLFVWKEGKLNIFKLYGPDKAREQIISYILKKIETDRSTLFDADKLTNYLISNLNYQELYMSKITKFIQWFVESLREEFLSNINNVESLKKAIDLSIPKWSELTETLNETKPKDR